MDSPMRARVTIIVGALLVLISDQGLTGSYVVLVEKSKRLLKGTRDDRPGVTTE